jgi:hypothetical protein
MNREKISFDLNVKNDVCSHVCDLEHGWNRENMKSVIRNQQSFAKVVKVLPCLRLSHSARTNRLN